jgi:probable F420-dependent oxidoreductase
VAAPIAMSVQARPVAGASWLELAREVDRSGFDSLYVADHPGTTAAPFVALAAAAAVTERIRLGTCVANAGTWEPLALAAAIASLDLVSSGRAVLGVGAGHTPAEWTMRGLPLPAASERVDRMIELVTAVRSLLAGETVSITSDQMALVDAALTDPRPVQQQVPLLIGGNGPRVLSYAAREADIVGVSGLARTLADGHTHEVEWSTADLDRTFDLIAGTTKAAGREPVIEALVQHIEITVDAEASAASLADLVPGATPIDLLDAPFTWIGTTEEIADELGRHRDRWGVTRYVIRQEYIEAAKEVLPALGT